MNVGGRRLPLLVTQSYGRGRTAVMATSGTWRWQMSQALGDPTHDLFWQQLLRWLAADSPGRVVASMPVQTLMDDGHVRLTATVRDKEFTPAPDARVVAHVIGPEGMSAHGGYDAGAEQSGTFQAGVDGGEAGILRGGGDGGARAGRVGEGCLTFERIDGVAENFHTEQNRELLEKLSSRDGRALLEGG